MLLCSLLVLSLILRPASARPAESSTSTTNGAPSGSSSSPNQSLDTGTIGATIGGEGDFHSDLVERSNDQRPIFAPESGVSAAVAAVVTIMLAFAMLRWSRKRNCQYHNNELGEIVPALPYWKRNVNAETASVDSSEFDVSA